MEIVCIFNQITPDQTGSDLIGSDCAGLCWVMIPRESVKIGSDQIECVGSIKIGSDWMDRIGSNGLDRIG